MVKRYRLHLLLLYNIHSPSLFSVYHCKIFDIIHMTLHPRENLSIIQHISQNNIRLASTPNIDPFEHALYSKVKSSFQIAKFNSLLLYIIKFKDYNTSVYNRFLWVQLSSRLIWRWWQVLEASQNIFNEPRFI